MKTETSDMSNPHSFIDSLCKLIGKTIGENCIAQGTRIIKDQRAERRKIASQDVVVLFSSIFAAKHLMVFFMA